MLGKDQCFRLKSRTGPSWLLLSTFFYLLASCFTATSSLHAQQSVNVTQTVTANADQSSPSPTSSRRKTDQNSEDDPEQMRKTIARLRAENERLRRKIADLEQSRTFSSIQDLLTKEEQRADNLHTQLLTIAEKVASLQSRMDELNEQLQPENIERMVIAGSVRPEEVREATRRRLNAEKRRIQSQLDLLQQNRSRLQASLAGVDLAIQRLRAQLQNSSRP